MGMILPSTQLSGKMPLSNIILNNFRYIGSKLLNVLFMCSFKILSLPGDLLFCNATTVSVISPVVIGKFIASL